MTKAAAAADQLLAIIRSLTPPDRRLLRNEYGGGQAELVADLAALSRLHVNLITAQKRVKVDASRPPDSVTRSTKEKLNEAYDQIFAGRGLAALRREKRRRDRFVDAVATMIDEQWKARSSN